MQKALNTGGMLALQVLGGLPLLVYPFLLLLGAISFDSGSKGILHVAIVAGAYLYPVGYVLFLVAAWQAARKGEYKRARTWSSYPVISAVIWTLITLSFIQ